MNLLITGATGLVGSKLLEKLSLLGHDKIRILTRDKSLARNKIPFPIEVYQWNPTEGKIDDGALNDVDIVIHLAGENVADSYWSKAQKDKIKSSRVNSTKLLLEEISKLETPPKKFICSSAIGIYGDRGDETLTEKSSPGQGFLAEVCREWERIVFDHNIKGMITHSIRTGIVLSTKGGALKKMLPVFKSNFGGAIGDGYQFMSWIHIDDLINQYIYLIKNQCSQRIFNGVSPNPVTNYTFTKILGSTLNKFTFLSVPTTPLKILLGEMSEILLTGQKVFPENFLNEKYKFEFPNLNDALLNLLGHQNNKQEILEKYQWIDTPPTEVFKFFTQETNLEKLTPDYLHFKVMSKSTQSISKGTTINYKLKIHGIPCNWKSLISFYSENHGFTDEQVQGPYKKWVHFHGFYPLGRGTLIQDKIIYQEPFGFIGKLFVGKFIKNDLEKIFNFRHKAITELFPKPLE